MITRRRMQFLRKADNRIPAHWAGLFRSAVALLIAVSAGTNGRAAQPPAVPTDLQVKAAYLYKFGAFVQWPAAPPGEAFTICVMGRDPFGPTLDATVNGETLEGRRLVTLRINSVHEVAPCRILYISESEEAQVKTILDAIGRTPVLTVSDIPNFSERGGMIQFVLENGRVRFRVNVASAEKAGLTLSSQLLKVASAVKRTEGRD